MLCSTKQLTAAAAPAISQIPIVAVTISFNGGTSGVAKSIPMIAQKTINATTRGLVSARNWLIALVVFGAANCMVHSQDSKIAGILACWVRELDVCSPDLGNLQKPYQIVFYAVRIGISAISHHYVSQRIDNPNIFAGIG